MMESDNPAANLSETQSGYIHLLKTQLQNVPWQKEALKTAVLDATLLTPIDLPGARDAIYRVLLNAETGPEAEMVLVSMNRETVLRLFGEVPWDEREFLETTGLTAGAFERWVASEKTRLVSIAARYRVLPDEEESSIVEFSMLMTDGKTHCRRVMLGEGKVEETARLLVAELEAESGLKIPFSS